MAPIQMGEGEAKSFLVAIREEAKKLWATEED